MKDNAFEQYMELIADASARRLREESPVILERFRQTLHANAALIPTVFFVDYTTRKYIYIDRNCLEVVGYPDTYYYEEGHEGFLRQVHPVDYTVVANRVFPVNLGFLAETPLSQMPEYIFSHNFRMKDREENYRIVLQRYSYIPGELKGKPVGVLGVAYDITHFKPGPGIIQTIERSVLSGNEMIQSLVYKQTYPVYEPVEGLTLTQKELEILPFLAKGWSSKQIATQLGRSVNTVSNHRKSMLRKTGCTSTAGLVQYAFRAGLL